MIDVQVLYIHAGVNEKTMIDTHVHILPGVDDGPATVADALTMARMLVQEGVRIAAATPHYNDEFPHRSASEIFQRVSSLQVELSNAGIPLRLCIGHEVLIKPRLVDDVRLGYIATLHGSRYLLLELWNSIWLPETERVVFELREHGIIPIIAHPERSRAIQQEPERLGTLLRLGALAQMTIGSLLGAHGTAARRSAEMLLKKGLIHCLASDAHGFRLRPPQIAQGLHYARQFLGIERVHFLTEVQPAAILTNELVGTPSLHMKVR
jgi:protein-tyrosine phosphatase